MTGEEAFPFGRSSRATTFKRNIILILNQDRDAARSSLFPFQADHLDFMQQGILFESVSILPSQPDKRSHFESIGASASAGDVLGVSLHTSAVMRLKCQVSGTEGLCERWGN